MMTLNSKHRAENVKTKSQRNRNMKNQNTQKEKPSFIKKIGTTCRFV